MSRNRSASGIFSLRRAGSSSRRSSVDLRFALCVATRRCRKSPMTTVELPARHPTVKGTPAGGFATAELRTVGRHDRLCPAPSGDPSRDGVTKRPSVGEIWAPSISGGRR